MPGRVACSLPPAPRLDHLLLPKLQAGCRARSNGPFVISVTIMLHPGRQQQHIFCRSCGSQPRKLEIGRHSRQIGFRTSRGAARQNSKRPPISAIPTGNSIRRLSFIRDGGTLRLTHGRLLQNRIRLFNLLLNPLFAGGRLIMIADILSRKASAFVLWRVNNTSAPPKLIIGQLKVGNPIALVNSQQITMQPVSGFSDLWEAPLAGCHLTEGEVYHYWFEVSVSHPGQPTTARLQITDPMAHMVDWRLRGPRVAAPFGDDDRYPAAVVKVQGGRLVAADADGEVGIFSGEPPLNTCCRPTIGSSSTNCPRHGHGPRKSGAEIWVWAAFAT